MSINSEIGRRLVFFQSFKKKARIKMKSKEYPAFIALIKDFNFEEEDDRVVFTRCDETIFPGAIEKDTQEEYMTYIKNIKLVEGL